MNSELWTAVIANAKALNIEPAALMAVVEVESSGKYFAVVEGKREPLIRFEGHYFDQRLSGSLKARARLRRLASPVAGAIKNPITQKDRWKLLEKACKINHSAALESTSWGLGQVMGAHWKWLGYENVEEMVATARSGIHGQIDLMVRYIKKSGLTPALHAHNWSTFARGYNGPSYAKLGYHLKLANAYSRAKIDEKTIKNNDLLRPSNSQPNKADRGKQVAHIQRQLTELGYVVAEDGVFDRSPDSAHKHSQQNNAHSEQAILGEPTSQALTAKTPKTNMWNWLRVFTQFSRKQII